MAKTRAQPTYVLVDPETEVEITRYKGAPVGPGGPESFSEFLKYGAR